MPKKQAKPSSDGAKNVSIPSPLKTSNSQLAPTVEQQKPIDQSTPQTNEKPVTLDERIANIENNIERLGKIVMQIVGYIDSIQKAKPQASLSQTPSTGTDPGNAGGINLGQIMPLIQEGLKIFSGPAQPPVDPMIMTIYKGIQDSYMEGFKSYIASINTKNKIADAVLLALEKGTLKLESGAEASA